MAETDYILAPPLIHVQFDVLPVSCGIESLRELLEVDRLNGFSEWVTQTAANLSSERRELNSLVFQAFETLFFEVMPVHDYADYLGYVDAIAARDPHELRDQVIACNVHVTESHSMLWPEAWGSLTVDRLLNDEAVFTQYIGVTCQGVPINDKIVQRAFTLYHDPPRMQATIVEHLRWMWDEILKDEWKRIEPMLQESAAAFSRLDFSNMTAYEAARVVTTRDLRVHLDKKLPDVDTVIFVPSAHIGPYVTLSKLRNKLYIMFGARLPRGAHTESSALSRSELLTRMSALADDTRLRILELLTQNEELCAQDIIEQLGLSQSSASRHLSQLSANGFIVERRREVAKCYSLNTDRVVDTLRTLTNFLSRP